MAEGAYKIYGNRDDVKFKELDFFLAIMPVVSNYCVYYTDSCIGWSAFKAISSAMHFSVGLFMDNISFLLGYVFPGF